MAFDRTKPADTDYISASAANLRENFRALAEDTRLYGTGAPESSAGQNGWRYVDTATGDEYLKVNNAWIKKTDLAALIRDLFVGAVSENEGVPTGAIIERGSNANGTYVKFADGTMIAYASLVMTVTNNNGNGTTGTLPATFISSPHLCVISRITSSGGTACRVLEGTTTQTTYTGKMITVANGGSVTGSGTETESFLFVGRWY